MNRTLLLDPTIQPRYFSRHLSSLRLLTLDLLWETEPNLYPNLENKNSEGVFNPSILPLFVRFPFSYFIFEPSIFEGVSLAGISILREWNVFH